MDESAQSFSNNHNHLESPKIYLPKPTASSSSGLTLVLPSLKSLKAKQKAHSRSGSIPNDVDVQDKKTPRPIKLKPLKEVLTKLIAQIKKKDDYAFFLTPVDVTGVPGYADVIKQPMDFGTITDKVNRGRYRSLEEFTNDVKLVTTNAKTFNPPGTIYYSEAERIEAWGTDHISRAASTVIQHEIDWTIDVERDDEPETVDIDDDGYDHTSTPMDVDHKPVERERSVSVASQLQPGPSRRGPRGPYRKSGQTNNGPSLAESLELDGGLPGSKDGIGTFPPGSDWARTMIALKLKGKRYKTKKERLRVEREGPPLLPDGSLDYAQMEDPFSFLSFFVPDPPSRSHLVPLYPPVSDPRRPSIPALTAPSLSAQPSTSSQAPQTPQNPLASHALPTASSALFPAATALPLSHTSRPISSSAAFGAVNADVTNRRRHWAIIRNTTSRQKGKEKEEEPEAPEIPSWQLPREPHALDYGSLAFLAGELAEEMKKRGVSASTAIPPSLLSNTVPPPSDVNTRANANYEEEITQGLIRESLDCETAIKDKPQPPEAPSIMSSGPIDAATLLSTGYFTSQRAAEAEEYIRDVVYGGVDGLAYVRSLAEFMSYEPDPDWRTHQLPSSAPTSVSGSGSIADSSAGDLQRDDLGMPLAKWVEQNIVDVFTEGRHALLRETAIQLARYHVRKQEGEPLTQSSLIGGTVASQAATSLHLYPAALLALSALLHIRMQKIDMAALIKTPDELFLSEEEWAGKGLKEKKRQKLKAVAAQGHDAMEVEEPERTWATVESEKGPDKKLLSDYELEGPDELREVLDYVATVILELDRTTREKAQQQRGTVKVKSEENGAGLLAELEAQDPRMRNLRLNLLALAKRAPLDTIARLPQDLVPEHIRHFIPTLGPTS